MVEGASFGSMVYLYAVTRQTKNPIQEWSGLASNYVLLYYFFLRKAEDTSAESSFSSNSRALALGAKAFLISSASSVVGRLSSGAPDMDITWRRSESFSARSTCAIWASNRVTAATRVSLRTAAMG